MTKARSKRRELAMKQRGTLTNVDTLEDTETFEDCCTIAVERDSLCSIEKALSLYEKILLDDSYQLKDASHSVDLLMVVASIFQLSQMV